ncbi:uncharacterized protein TrAtP1_007456 [Trichoderma atroviride]|uniref:uncharacterized protein n=1 Tax=Hypocrea atroviridis TaxID=63577 RepID=UPI003332815B|nr:hypothetical protein TrAtP1_007456 [Trichoderma atroviride]
MTQQNESATASPLAITLRNRVLSPPSRLQPAKHLSNALHLSSRPFPLNPVVCMPDSDAKHRPIRSSMLQSPQPISRPAPRRHAGHAARSAAGAFLLPHRR